MMKIAPSVFSLLALFTLPGGLSATAAIPLPGRT